jgi:Domain of unknown function (DUF1843)
MPAKKSAAKAKAAPQPLYAVPIYAAVKRGNAAEMKKLAAAARKHIKDVTSALASLEKKLDPKK